MSSVLTLAIIVIVLIVMYKLIHQSTRPRVSARKPTTSMDTILVVLPCYEQASSYLKQLFAAARVPSNVFVACVAHTRLSPMNLEFQSHVRVSQSTNFGGSVDRQIAIRECYQGERYVLFCHEHSWFLPSWDTMLIKSLAKVHRNGGHVVSCFPYEHRRSNGDMPTQSLPSTFPVFDRFHHSTPQFRGRFYPQPTTPPIRQGVASFQCLFASADVLIHGLDIHNPSIPWMRSHEADFILSIELWSNGYDVYSPTQSPLVRLHPDERMIPGDASTDCLTFKHLILQYFLFEKQADMTDDQRVLFEHKISKCDKPPTRFHDWLGVNIPQQQLAGRLFLGLLREYTPHEIDVKYTTVFNFEQLKSYYCS